MHLVIDREVELAIEGSQVLWRTAGGTWGNVRDHFGVDAVGLPKFHAMRAVVGGEVGDVANLSEAFGVGTISSWCDVKQHVDRQHAALFQWLKAPGAWGRFATCWGGARCFRRKS
jgi:hypothetical protein